VAPAAAVPKSTTPAAGKKAAGTANNFNTYNNTDQQNAKGYVLNTKTKKFHLPSCNDVPKISKDNYGTAATRNEAIAKGYKPCGHYKP
jgi:methylphosphotriester-DNA--protein-cysteine methyltransferase